MTKLVRVTHLDLALRPIISNSFCLKPLYHKFPNLPILMNVFASNDVCRDLPVPHLPAIGCGALFLAVELPILTAGHGRGLTQDAVARAIKRARLDLFSTFSQRTETGGATVLTNPERGLVHDAHAIFDLTAADDSAEAVLDEALGVFEMLGLKCAQVASAEHVATPAVERALANRGFRAREQVLMAMVKHTACEEQVPSGVQVVPARALIADYREFRNQSLSHHYGAEAGAQIAACMIDELDEPRLDVLVARSGGRITAAAGVWAAGETGILWDVATHPECLRRGYMRALMAHVVDLCQRSQYRSVVLDTDPDNVAAIGLYESIGFQRIGSMTEYWADWTQTRGI